MSLAATTSQTTSSSIALVALAGAVVGGLLTGGAQLLAEWMRHARDREVAEAGIRGVARVLDYFLALWETLLEQANEQGEWWNANLEPDTGWTDSDLQLIASSCVQQQWAEIRAALVVTRTAAIMRATAGRDSDLEYGKVINPGKGLEIAVGMGQAIGAGRSALRDLG